MKKSFILSALAGLALTASAQTVQIEPKPFSPETLVAGQPMYPVQVLATGMEMVNTANEGDYLKFASVGKADKSEWLSYTAEDELNFLNETIYTVPQIVTSMGITPVVSETTGDVYTLAPTISIGFTAGQPIDLVDCYTKTILKENLEGGTYYTTAKYQYISGNNAYDYAYCWVGEQNVDGTYFVADAPYGEAVESLAGAAFLAKANAFKFVGEAQYQFHLIAQAAADFAATTEYRGGCFDELKAACETPGAQWVKQYIEVERLLAKFTAQVWALKTEMDNVNFGQIEFDKQGDLVVTGAEGDVVELTICETAPMMGFVEYNEYFSFDPETSVMTKTVTVGADGTVTVPVYYIPAANEYMADATNIHKALIQVVIEGANSPFIMKSNKFNVEVCGVNPVMSFENDAIVKSAYLPVTSWEKPEKIVFFTAGYDLENAATEGTITNEWFRADNDKNLHNKPIATIEGADAEDFEVEIAPCTDEDVVSFLAPGIKAWTATVTLNSLEARTFAAKVVINDTYNAANNIVLNVEAGNVDFEVVAENPVRGILFNKQNVRGVDFPLEGGEVVLDIYAYNFNGVNAHKQIAGVSDNDQFSVYFEGAPNPEVSSPCLEGNPHTKVKIVCEPAPLGGKGVVEGTITLFINQVKVEIPVTRTYPNLVRNIYDVEKNEWKTTAEKLNIKFGGEEIDMYQHEVEFVIEDLVNYYDMDDLKIYTEQSVFQITNTARHFNTKDGKLYVTVNLKYLPCLPHDIDRDILVVEIPGREKGRDNVVIVELEGNAGSARTIAAVKGETDGIVGVAADKAANKTVYTISGARAAESTKGIVIENGKKVIK